MRSISLVKAVGWTGVRGILMLACVLALVSCSMPDGMENAPIPTAELGQEPVAASTSPTAPATTTAIPSQEESAVPSTEAESPADAVSSEPRPVIEADTLMNLAPLHILEGHSDDVTDVVFSPDGSMLASSSRDGTIRLWHVEDGSLLRTFSGHAHNVLSIAFSPDGALLVSGSDDRTARVWRVSDGALLHTIRNLTEGRVLKVSFSPDGSLFAMADHLCYVQLRRSGSGILYRILTQPGCAARVNGSVAAWGMEFTKDGETIITAEGQPGRGGSLHLWRVDEYTMPYLLSGYKMMVRDLMFSPDETALAVALLGSQSFILMDAEDGRWLQTFEGHSAMVNSVAFSPDGSLIASASQDWTIGLWQAGDGALIHTLKGHTGGVNRVAFSPDGSLIASASADGSLILWGIPTP